MCRLDEPGEKLRNTPAGTFAVQRATVHTETLDQHLTALLGCRPIVVDRERTLHTVPRELVVRDHHPNLPHTRPTLTHRPRTTPPTSLTIPVTSVHPYIYRDRNRDDPAPASPTRQATRDQNRR